jgi:pimeloyl-ACP methyl ester carboxylesterase
MATQADSAQAARTLTTTDAAIRYDVHAGAGRPALLVHGWACRRSDWDPIIPGMAHHRVLAVDLPAHGASTTTRTAWTMAQFGEVIADLVEAEHLDDVVLVGHSMGGAAALEAAAILGPRVRHVIGLDCFVQQFLYPRQDESTVQAAMSAFRLDYPAAIRSLVQRAFPDRSKVELMERIIAEMSATAATSAIPALESLYRWDQDAVLAKVLVPVSVLAAHVTDEARHRYGPRIHIEQISLGGHFFLREQPQAIAKALTTHMLRD